MAFLQGSTKANHHLEGRPMSQIKEIHLSFNPAETPEVIHTLIVHTLRDAVRIAALNEDVAARRALLQSLRLDVFEIQAVIENELWRTTFQQGVRS